MAKSSNTSKGDAEILNRLQSLEEQIKTHDEVQKKLRYISLSGILVILLLIGLFIFRLVTYVQNYNVQEVVGQIDVAEVVRPELDFFVNELRAELLPAFSDHILDEFRKATPEIKGASFDLMARVETQFRKRAEERILNSLIKSLEVSNKEIKEIFPEFSSENLEKQIGKSMEYYIERLHDALEERIAFVVSSLEDLKGTARQIVHNEELQAHLPSTTGEAEEQFLDAVLDLLIYEIKPNLGLEIAEQNN